MAQKSIKEESIVVRNNTSETLDKLYYIYTHRVGGGSLRCLFQQTAKG